MSCPIVTCRGSRGVFSLQYRISSNNSQGRLLLIFGAPKGGDYSRMPIIRGRGLFQIFLTGSRALNTLVYYPIKLKNNHIKLTEHGLFKCSKFGFLVNFQCQYPRIEKKVKYISIIIEKTVTKPVLL